jgi:hypothetical protein
VWSPQTIQQAVRLAVEIPSHRRAAAAFSELTGVGISKSSLQRLCEQVGSQLVARQSAEARAVVAVPKQDEVVRREVVTPDSDVMSVSSDGVMLHLRTEGWKEVKGASISAVKHTEAGPTLTQHSYRAGLWEASLYGHHLWAEACRRGLERARTVVCVSDGAIWIWNLMFMCFALRVEILDWWHAVQRLWTMAQHHFTTPAATTAWVEAQQAALAHSHFRQIVQQVRQHQELPRRHRAVHLLAADLIRDQTRLARADAAIPEGGGHGAHAGLTAFATSVWPVNLRVGANSPSR